MTSKVIFNYFQAIRHKYNSGFACVHAVNDFRHWLAQQGIVNNGSVRVWLATDDPPLQHNHGEPPGEFKVFTNNATKYKLVEECFWVPVVMDEERVVVRWCAAHEVAPINLVDKGNVLVDPSIDQFIGDAAHLEAYL